MGHGLDPLPGQVQEWVSEHKARLRLAFENAHEKLLAAAGRCKERHDQWVHEAPLIEGQRVYLRDHGVRGHQKIRDLQVYQVVKAQQVKVVFKLLLWTTCTRSSMCIGTCSRR